MYILYTNSITNNIPRRLSRSQSFDVHYCAFTMGLVLNNSALLDVALSMVAIATTYIHINIRIDTHL